jgi:transcriptional regulator with XRE-family HTH domain
MSLTGEQIRAARAILRLDQISLAERAGVSVETIKRLEKFDGSLEPRAQFGTLQDIRRVFELAGLDLEGGGVRWAPKYHELMIAAFAGEVESFVRNGLERDARKDPKLFDRGVEHVTNRLAFYLARPLLEAMVRRVMPKERG